MRVRVRVNSNALSALYRPAASPCFVYQGRYPVIFSITSELTISSSITQGNTSSGFLIFPGELLAACCPAKCQRSNKKVDE